LFVLQRFFLLSHIVLPPLIALAFSLSPNSLRDLPRDGIVGFTHRRRNLISSPARSWRRQTIDPN